MLNCLLCVGGKKLSMEFTSLKDPNTTSSMQAVKKMSNRKPSKHIHLVPLSNIK